MVTSAELSILWNSKTNSHLNIANIFDSSLLKWIDFSKEKLIKKMIETFFIGIWNGFLGREKNDDDYYYYVHIFLDEID